ncbi:nuclear transport factor 2 family protein [Sphingomonas crocodyli]|uniref:nuclear transport factor 2 family protein n=1 Tax=Sphingomonas crocodyli TaxID=1979270 RepID=UPI0013E2E2C7|nr:nuclear transport factor 2 family protein [Sphingomonas crocodyli]
MRARIRQRPWPILVALLATAGLPAASVRSSPPAAALQDRAEIEEVVVGLANATDSRDWRGVEALLADQVDLEYRTLTRDTPPIRQRVSPAQFVVASQGTLPGFLHTQHLIGNIVIRVEGKRAEVVSQVWMSHYLPADQGPPYWNVAGTYRHDLVKTRSGWKISAMHVVILFETGNDRLQALAAERVRAGLIATAP